MIPIKLLYLNYKGGLQLNELNWLGPKILKKKKKLWDMKPKWGDISKYMGLENPSLLPLKLHVHILMRLPFASAASHYWTLLLFTVVVSRDYRYGFYDYTNRKRAPKLVIIFD